MAVIAMAVAGSLAGSMIPGAALAGLTWAQVSFPGPGDIVSWGNHQPEVTHEHREHLARA